MSALISFNSGSISSNQLTNSSIIISTFFQSVNFTLQNNDIFSILYCLVVNFLYFFGNTRP